LLELESFWRRRKCWRVQFKEFCLISSAVQRSSVSSPSFPLISGWWWYDQEKNGSQTFAIKDLMNIF
jgi:hypothetical protein